MSENRSEASREARTRPWWAPFLAWSIVLMIVGLWLRYRSTDTSVHVIGRATIAASVIAMVGIGLTFFWWGRAIMGVSHRPHKWFPFLFTFRGWTQAVVITFTCTLTGAFEYTMDPDFCQSCHLMQPYYTAWHESTHSKVACTDCHFEPGWQNTLKGKFQASSMLVRYLTDTYGSKPHAQIQDASCLRSNCHATRVLEGAAAWEHEKPNGAVVSVHFDHAPHLGELRRGRQLRCTSCHSQIVQGEHIAVTLDTCYICHFKGLKHARTEEVLGGCTGCHKAPKETIRLATGEFNHKAYIDRGVACYNCHSDSIRGDGEVPRQVCWNCHNLKEQVERYGDSNFVHDQHVSRHKVRCTECHLKIEHGINVGTQHAPAGGDSCSKCHESMHAGPAELYQGVGGRGVPDMPSPMFRAQVDCIGCHQFREHFGAEKDIVGQTFAAAQQSCNMCHGDEGDPATGKYADRLGEWQRVLKEKSDAAQRSLSAAEDALGKAALNDVERLPLARKLADARHNVALVQLGRGEHNFNYAVALLSVADQNCAEVTRACAGAAP